MLVALNFSTLAARFPISGAIYQWSSRLAGQTFGWFTGWIMIIGQILTVAAAAIALQAVLPSIWPGFQFIGGAGANPSPTSPTGAENAVVLGVILLAVTTTINIIGVRLMSIVNSTGVVLEILGVIAIAATLLFHARRGPSVLFTTTGAAPTPGTSYIWAWLASGLMACYVMVGFDSAGELSEETHAPRRITARTIIRALVVSGVGGAFLLFGALLAAPSLTDGHLATVGLPWVLTSIMGPVGGRILLVDVTIAICVCTLACQASGSRMMYSMARQRALPFHRALGRVSPRTGTPIVTSIVVGAGAVLTLAVNVGRSAIFSALASLCIAMLYLAYLGVTGPLLVARIRQARHRGSLSAGVDETGRPLFSLGRWGILLNLIAVAYQIVAIVNLAGRGPMTLPAIPGGFSGAPCSSSASPWSSGSSSTSDCAVTSQPRGRAHHRVRPRVGRGWPERSARDRRRRQGAARAAIRAPALEPGNLEPRSSLAAQITVSHLYLDRIARLTRCTGSRDGGATPGAAPRAARRSRRCGACRRCSRPRGSRYRLPSRW